MKFYLLYLAPVLLIITNMEFFLIIFKQIRLPTLLVRVETEEMRTVAEISCDYFSYMENKILILVDFPLLTCSLTDHVHYA